MTIRAFSVIVCTYNRANFLPRVISRLRVQNYPANAFEIILVDNGSTDDTKQVVERLEAEPGVPIRYVFEGRSGVTFARNRGAEEAHYSHLAYLDDDCSVGADWLSRLDSGFDLDKYVSIVAGRIKVDYGVQKIPAWLGPKLEGWLGEYNFPGTKSHLLDNPSYICEGNMAISRQACEEVGGFLGMDQFNSPHIAAKEITYLLEKVKRKGGKVAFVPEAIAHHHTIIPSQWRMLMRAYSNGISDSILDYLLKRSSGIAVIYRPVLDIMAMSLFLCLSFFFLLIFDKAASMYHLVRAAARFGRVLSELHLVGDWRRVRLWVSTLHLSRD
jgi:glycosyltransferase involved in cell wall biosynthesis